MHPRDHHNALSLLESRAILIVHHYTYIRTHMYVRVYMYVLGVREIRLAI